MKRIIAAALCAGSLAGRGAATAGIIRTQRINDFEVSLYRRTWHVTSYFVQDDLMANPNDTTFFSPESMVYSAGKLYASGDREDYETDSRVAIYLYPVGGPLAFSSYLQMPNVSPNWWGPEGLTFNTSGTGYGSAAGQLVSVERDETGQAGIISLSTGQISSKLAIPTPEDITFLPAVKRFAVDSDLGTSMQINWYDQNMTALGESFLAAPTMYGLVGVSAGWGSWFTRSAQAAEILVGVTKANPGNGFLAYDQLGNQIGPQQDLPVVPQAKVPLGGGWYTTYPAFGAIEAVGVDEAHKVIFLGDRDNTMIHVLTPASPMPDFDRNGYVNSADYSHFISCALGPGIPQTDPTCQNADFNGDGSVDGEDFGVFQRCYSGTDPAVIGCDD